ncbi:uncharacterized protein YjiS (DUF1127 family) [Stella humosa]|uniref:Uncharacterized protein YjiS (DUF1127 family) n=1 Tax=Stella humosa TaxID=94 RepID=A0A3N1LQ44_9PROT|nr:DUF1127 domain-containing protein [Stella humosa]ROP91315.1 uncharacterized protein YjiS (DUF1127 family) [Stella humosa]BBK34329.1 hypothetical protein STHU_49630 [Stella humosa]
MTTNTPSLSRPVALGAPSPRPALLLRFLFALLRWQDQARQRQHLAALDPRMLRDMGMTPDEVSRQLGKVYWRH